MSNKVIYTGSIPQCPFCKKPTKRTGGGGGGTTMAYQPSFYDEYGTIVHTPSNRTTSNWQCLECLKGYTVTGNGNGENIYEL